MSFFPLVVRLLVFLVCCGFYFEFWLCLVGRVGLG